MINNAFSIWLRVNGGAAGTFIIRVYVCIWFIIVTDFLFLFFFFFFLFLLFSSFSFFFFLFLFFFFFLLFLF